MLCYQSSLSALWLNTSAVAAPAALANPASAAASVAANAAVAPAPAVVVNVKQNKK